MRVCELPLRALTINLCTRCAIRYNVDITRPLDCKHTLTARFLDLSRVLTNYLIKTFAMETRTFTPVLLTCLNLIFTSHMRHLYARSYKQVLEGDYLFE